MKKWINAHVNFPDRTAVFTLPRNAGVIYRLLETMSWTEENQDEQTLSTLEEYTRQIIENARPDLKGCILWFIGFDPAYCRFEFGVAHPSLPPVRRGEMLPKMSLFDDATS